MSTVSEKDNFVDYETLKKFHNEIKIGKLYYYYNTSIILIVYSKIINWVGHFDRCAGRPEKQEWFIGSDNINADIRNRWVLSISYIFGESPKVYHMYVTKESIENFKIIDMVSG